MKAKDLSLILNVLSKSTKDEVITRLNNLPEDDPIWGSILFTLVAGGKWKLQNFFLFAGGFSLAPIITLALRYLGLDL